MEFRAAVQSDMLQIRRLYQMLFCDMAAISPDSFAPGAQDARFLKAVVESPMADIIVAVRGRRVAALALVQQMDTPVCSFFVPHSYAYLMDLIVHPNERGRGLGRQMVERVELWARERGLDYLELSAVPDSRAHELYTQLGFRSVMHTMRRKL